MTHLVITGSSGVRPSDASYSAAQALDMPPTEEVKIAFGAVHTVANDATRVLRLFALGNCWVAYAKKGEADPTAADPNFPMQANVPETIRLGPGDKITATTRT